MTPKDVFPSEAKSRSVFSALILHSSGRSLEYGNSIIKGVWRSRAGVMSVSSNTIYPLLEARRLRSGGSGQSETTQVLQFITPEGEKKYAEIKERFEDHFEEWQCGGDPRRDLTARRLGKGEPRLCIRYKAVAVLGGGDDGRCDRRPLRQRGPRICWTSGA